MPEKIELPAAKLNLPEFIAWAMEQPRGRFELEDGVVVAMAPERVGRSRAKVAAVNALARAIAASGRTCEAIGDGVAVSIDDGTCYEPDAVVTCGERLPDDVIPVPEPVVIV